MARLRGRQGFWTLDLGLSPDTLIPRADSETLIEAAIAARPDRASVRAVLDLGTGSGALLLAALVEYPRAWGLGVDVSPEACAQAGRNAASNGVASRAAFVCGDWAACLDGRFDLVLSNPPYIRRPDLEGLDPEVATHEPRRALDGGEDGLAAYRLLAPVLGGLLSAGGTAILEHGQGQGGDVAEVVAASGLVVVATPSDLGGVRRAVVARKPV